jgi:hypothetical protein
MTAGGWRYAAASTIGTSHIRSGTACQDANDCQLYQTTSAESILVGVISDGAGSAKFGGEGAALCCSVFIDLVSDHLSSGNTVEQICPETTKFWINVIKNRIKAAADLGSQDVREYACTLLGAVVGEMCAAFLQVGDGAIVVADSEEPNYGHVFWPDKGEYENMTHFVVEDAATEHLQFDVIRRRIVELGMFSDGLQRLALDYRSQTAFQPFFRGLFEPLLDAPSGRSGDLSNSLIQFLSSARVNEKTDDDKTLILATRRPQKSANDKKI